MKLIKELLEAVKRDKSYLLGFFLASVALSVLFHHHNWQSGSIQATTQKINTQVPEFSKIANIAKRKQAFIEYLTPLVNKENNRIKYQQALLKSIIEKLESESYHVSANSKKLHKLARQYGLEARFIMRNIDELKNRIDIIPSNLIVSVAAFKSNWGTLPQARQNNNLFLLNCEQIDCNSKIPSTVVYSISQYLNFLNAHPSNAKLRQKRNSIRNRGQRMTSLSLVGDLFSDDAAGQTDQVIAIIKNNLLE